MKKSREMRLLDVVKSIKAHRRKKSKRNTLIHEISCKFYRTKKNHERRLEERKKYGIINS